MLRDLNSILGVTVDRLNELDTSDVLAMGAGFRSLRSLTNRKPGSACFSYANREYVPEGLRKSLPHQEALANAPDADEHFFQSARK